jgi:methylated-DNA-[protein]-cysteine S-methyltransferase
MKSFNERCYELLRKVPAGKVTTYKDLAEAMKTKAYRAVGNAMNKNPYAYAAPVQGERGSSAAKQVALVPCHRVIKSSGSLGGFAFGAEKKIAMLKKEGIEIKNGKIDLDKYRFRFILT